MECLHNRQKPPKVQFRNEVPSGNTSENTSETKCFWVTLTRTVFSIQASSACPHRLVDVETCPALRVTGATSLLEVAELTALRKFGFSFCLDLEIECIFAFSEVSPMLDVHTHSITFSSCRSGIGFLESRAAANNIDPRPAIAQTPRETTTTNKPRGHLGTYDFSDIGALAIVGSGRTKTSLVRALPHTV